jgi:hypothetical protein
MIKLSKFTGINNVLPGHRLGNSELATATDVDIGMSGEVYRRKGFTRVSAASHRFVHAGNGRTLAVQNGDLILDGTTPTVLLPSLGASRVWYCDLPDGRTAFSNGLISGVTNGTSTTPWGIPLPPGIGALTFVAGDLYQGDYQYAITYVRNSDGLEGAPSYSNPVPVPDGGVLLTGLPVEPGYRINVYLSSVNGGQMFYAGMTVTSSFSYLGKNSSLTMPCRTEFLHPMPVGILPVEWRGRVLVAKDNVLWASELHRPELCDMRTSFKQFGSPITLVQPVEDGIFVGTTTELAFLSGNEFVGLTYAKKLDGAVVLGSGVFAAGERIKRGDSTGQGIAMLCIADGIVAAGFRGGEITRMTEGRYKTAVTEVVSAFRMNGAVPQYVAIPV